MLIFFALKLHIKNNLNIDENIAYNINEIYNKINEGGRYYGYNIIGFNRKACSYIRF